MITHCSVESAGEVLSSTAPHFEAALVLEIPPPWPTEMDHPAWGTSAVPEEVQSVFRETLPNLKRKTRVMGVMPDEEYSTPGRQRLMYFEHVPGTLRFGRRELHVAHDAVPEAVADLLAGGQVSDTAERDLLVCTHGGIDVCCARLGYPLYHQLREKAGPGARVWRTTAISGHRFAPTLIDMPDGTCWGRLDQEHLALMLGNTASLDGLAGLYRGWCALDGGDLQAVEEELFFRFGRQWRNGAATLERTADRSAVVATVAGETEAQQIGFKIAAQPPREAVLGCKGQRGQVTHYTVQELV
ncbi:MAG: sucrase ferredoxin [Propionibacteriaceae bacterium]|nr:sucrase ferredoxin [Propionibacteriaceae bacterium]